MEQSELYRNVLTYAESMCRKDGKSIVNADYFVAALLNMVLAESRSELGDIPEINITQKSAAASELAAVRRILSHYSLNIMEVAVRMEAAARSHEDDSLMGVDFRRHEVSAERLVGAEGKTKLTSDAVLEVLLKDPTDHIRRFITSCWVSGGADVDRTEPRTPLTPLEQLIDIGNNADNADDTDDDELVDSDEKGGMFGKRVRRSISERSGDLFGGYRGNDEYAHTAQQQSPQADAPRARAQEMPQQPAEDILMSQAKRIKEVQNKLLDRVFGQDMAVEMFVSGYFQAELVSAIMNKRKKPRATFLFAGPPGVGKTFLAESAAEILNLPFKRFDMSEYSEDESTLNFAGTDKVYKGAHEGAVTGFVSKNPRSILLFDEVEKAHINIIFLFLQMLDAGRLRDTFTEQVVDFSDTIIIFTTNAGKRLYDDTDIANLSGVPRKTVLRAISNDTRPNGTPFFPEAICSRFASGNVVMFNRLDAHFLLKIAGKELQTHAQALHEKTGVNIEIDNNINYAILYSEGGNADARAIRGKAVNFFYRELYEFYRLASADKNRTAFDTVKIEVQQPDDDRIKALFVPDERPEVLVFADGETAEKCRAALPSVTVHTASDVEQAKTVLAENNISVIVCDIKCGQRSARRSVLNLEDIDSAGRDFFNYVGGNVNIPLYLLGGGYDISAEELLSFSRNGAMGVVGNGSDGLEVQVREKCNIAKQQRNMLELARACKVLSYQTAQSFSDDGKTANITLFDLKLAVAVDAEDGNNVLSGMSRPDLRFSDVIGAEDAKRELGYFTEFLKNPKMFAKNGVRPPKGILLYGPPGTGKTMLAKALAGESDVTYIAAEGNAFLKKYVGEGPALVHELFATARKYAPSVLFIDEIDAIAVSRADLSSDRDNTSNILTALLTEMDGFKTHPDRPVFVLAATNVGVDGSDRKRLDPALLRRFDRRILVDLPNRTEREMFIRMQASRNSNIKLSDGQIANIAMRSTGMSLADLQSVTEMALRKALGNGDFTVTDDIIEEAFESYNSGEAKKWSDDTLLRTARHEAGHALMCRLSGETPSYLTIVARDSHGGYMQHGDKENKQLYTKNELLGLLRTSLGGRAAELVCYGDEDGVTTGPSSDLRYATNLVEQLICTYGMDEKIGLGSVDIAAVMNTPYYAVIRERTNEILAEQLALTKAEISKRRAALDRLVDALLEKNKLRGEEIEAILGVEA